MMKEDVIDGSRTVNETIRLLPGSVEVFNRFGIDACCGGAATLADAALRDGAPLPALLLALREVATAQP